MENYINGFLVENKNYSIKMNCEESCKFCEALFFLNIAELEYKNLSLQRNKL
jgi:hypothetical protein